MEGMLLDFGQMPIAHRDLAGMELEALRTN